MPPDCVAELRTSEKHTTIGLLARHECGVSTIVEFGDFSKLSHLVGVVTQVLKFCSILKKNVNPDHCTTFDGKEREVAEMLLIKGEQSCLRENSKFKQWEKQLRVFTDQGVMRCQG